MTKFFCYGRQDFCDCDILCEDCGFFNDSGGEDREVPLISRADRIRSMSDQELAAFLCDHGGCSFKTCPGSELCNASDGKANGILKWLQQPAEGE